jgi:hypothetical protein
MKNIFLYTVLSVLVICFLFSQTLNGQTTFQSTISATVGVSTADVVVWGLQPGATNNLDSLIWPTEKEAPPYGPIGVPDLRFINTPSLSTDFGMGTYHDFRGALSPTQIDTFVLACKNYSGSNPIHISWPAGLASVCGTLSMIDGQTGGLVLNINMLYTTSVDLPAGAGLDPPYELYIIRTEAKPVLVLTPLSLNFGTVFIGAPQSRPVTFDNTTGTADLVVSSITLPDPTYTVDQTAPWTVPAGTIGTLNVTFTPVAPGTVAGNIVVNHNADTWTSTIPVTATAGDPGSFRSFTAAELVTLNPAKSKLYSLLKRTKPDKVEFELNLTGLKSLNGHKVNQIHMEWGAALAPATFTKFSGEVPPQVVKKNSVVQVLGVDYTLTGVIDGKNKKYEYIFADSLEQTDVIQFHGYAVATKPIKASYWVLPTLLYVPDPAKPTSTKMEKYTKVKLLGTEPVWTLNMPRLPMPNYGNVVFDIFPGVKAGGSGIVLGTPNLPLGSRTEFPKIIPGWLKLYDGKGLQGTLRGKTAIQGGAPRWFDFYVGGIKPVAKENKSLPPEKHDNVLMANLVTLKFNILASAQTNAPAGFGELTYYEPGNALHGLTLDSIYNLASPKMTTQDVAFDYANLNTVLAAVNGAFSGPLDTVSFSTKTEFKGTKTLSEISFLRRGTLAAKIIPTPAPYEIPETFVVEQNYPNPFNPTTTIEFSLPEDAIVTLKVYNMLGEEVATLVDREEMTYGLERLDFNASALSSGVYFYRIVAQGIESGVSTQIVKKMVLMK